MITSENLDTSTCVSIVVIIDIFVNIFIGKAKAESPHTLRLLSFPLQYTTATSVLINVATIAGAIIPAGFTLPY